LDLLLQQHVGVLILICKKNSVLCLSQNVFGSRSIEDITKEIACVILATFPADSNSNLEPAIQVVLASLNISRAISPRRIRSAAYVACMFQERKMYPILVGETNEKKIS
jgi:hypothetical protein